MKKIIKTILEFVILIGIFWLSLNAIMGLFSRTIAQDEQYRKGDIRLGNAGKVSETGSVSVTAGAENLDSEGNVQVTKTVSVVDGSIGKYKVDFLIKGKELTNVTSQTKDSYTVFVLDASRSMNGSPWNNALPAAISFSESFVAAGENNYLALVTFNSKGYQKRDFSNEVFTKSNFGSMNTGTNYNAGLTSAYNYLNALSDETKENAALNIIFISDGEPNKDSYTQTLSNIKNMGVNIYSFAYNLDVEKDASAYNKLLEISTNNEVTSIESDNIDSILSNFVEKVTTSTPAGTNATLTDGIGGKFKIVTEDNNEESSFGVNYESGVISEITEEGTKISFYIQIDPDATTGWHNTNMNFRLTYTDASGITKVIICDINPQVYWIQNEYMYLVRYYKDSIDESNLIASDLRYAVADTVIDENNVQKNKYLSKAGEDYKVDTSSIESIIIKNDGKQKVINVLYTIQRYSYNVNYYYDEIIDKELSYIADKVDYGTVIEPSTHYLSNDKIKKGYKLDLGKTNQEDVTIDSDGKSINIYYAKDSYEYTVNYYFDGVLDNSLTKTETATYENVIKATNNALSSEELSENKYNDYFLHPNKTSDSEQIKIGTDTKENVLNLYYVKTDIEDENIDKVAKNTTNITSSKDSVKYEVNYTSTIKNIKENETITITLTEPLTYEIDASKSNLNGGVYNNNAITWTIEETASEFTENYEVDVKINYEVVYKNIANISSEENNKLVSNIVGSTYVANKTTEGATASAATPVEIYGDLTVEHVDTNGLALFTKESTTKKVGTTYTTNEKVLYGYKLQKVIGTESGKYSETDTTVTYVYIKTTGIVKMNNIELTGPNNVISINAVFNYTLKYTGEITDYVGDASLTLTDTLPYEIDETKSTYDNRCSYDNKVITCTDNYDISENNQKITDEFKISVVFKNISSDIVTNKVASTLTYGANSATDKAELETTVSKGSVTAKYVDESNNEIADSVTITGLVGTNYQTTSKTIYGYTFKEVKGSETGKYDQKETIITYVYTKTDGAAKENKVEIRGPKNVISINAVFDYTITYSGEITDYVGETTLTITDTLPYEIDIVKSTYDNRCNYDNKVITCTENYEITEDNQEITDEFKISVVFKNIVTDKLINRVASSLSYGLNTNEDTAELETTVSKGKTTALYVDESSNEIADSVTTTGLIGTSYQTKEKIIYGYTLKKVIGAESADYKESTTITYVYIKNSGTPTINNLEIYGPKNIISVNIIFDYTITYSGEITDYVGETTLTITDTLPYEIDTVKSTYDNRCNYDNNVLTCTEIYEITEDNQKIEDEFKISVVFKNIISDKLINKVSSTLNYGQNSDKDTTELETTIAKSKTTAIYVDEFNRAISSSVTTIGLVGTNYQTSSKTIYGYTQKEIKGTETGSYVEDNTIVTYVYDKNEGTPITNNLAMTGLKTVNNVNDTFDYTITYTGKITDYIGDATLRLTSPLIYEIDEEKSTLDERCTYYNRVITCTENYEISQNNQEINAEFKLSLAFKDISINTLNINTFSSRLKRNATSNILNKEVTSQLVYGGNEIYDEANWNTGIPEGALKINYITEDGIELSQSMTSNGLVGEKYTIEQKVFDSYYLKEIIGESTGTYTEEETEITYVYGKDPLPPQTGTYYNYTKYISIFAIIIIILIIKRRYF